jgi:vacuolar-type H+-ATPase subunit F/Vma7
MEKRLFVIGHHDAVLGLALVGVDGLATGDPERALATLADLRREQAVGLVLITADLAQRLGDRLEAFREAGDLPIVYEIPTREGRPAYAPAAELVRRALGVGA